MLRFWMQHIVRKLTLLDLVTPSSTDLDAYADALRRGWSPDNVRIEEAPREELEAIADDPIGFLAALDNREANGPPITLPDGSVVARLPAYRRWMWDGEFCGSIGFRWQPGTSALPAHCLGHISYSVVPWKRGRGYATRALALMLIEARREGLDYVDLTADLDNWPSHNVIMANNGVFLERFRKEVPYGAADAFLFRIQL
jgi:predicted acetyltransferase